MSSTIQLTLTSRFEGYETTVTSAGIKTLTSASPWQQRFTGSTGHTLDLPVTSTLVLGFSFYIVNNSTGPGNIAVRSSGGNSIMNVPPGSSALLTCVLTSGTTAASWSSATGLTDLAVMQVVALINTEVAPVYFRLDHVDNDPTLALNDPGFVASQQATKAYVDSRSVPRVLTDRISDAASTSTDGTEDTLTDDLIAGGTLLNNGDKIVQSEIIEVVASATATRRIRKYLASFPPAILWDSGALTLSLGAEFHLQTTWWRVNDTTVRCEVVATTTSASTVPYVTYTGDIDITGSEFSSSDHFTRTTAIAAGIGAAAGDILVRASTISFVPAGSLVI